MKKIIFNKGQLADFGLLALRLGLGVMIFIHGWLKLEGGWERLEKVGSAVKHLGINGNFEIFGLAAALAEVLGGISLITGFLFTPMMLALTGTLAMATIMKLNTTEGFPGYSYPLEMAIVFFGLMIIGPGKYSIDRKISGK